MGVQIEFNYQVWARTFPALAAYISAEQAQQAFALATLYQANDGSGPINCCDQARALLNLATAHVATLLYPTSGLVANPDPASPLVGRISGATEGSVNVQSTMDMPPGSAQWWNQSVYGAAWWEATAQWRTMRYVPSRLGIGPYGPFGFVNGGFTGRIN